MFYLIGSLMITINVSPDNPDLFGGEGTNASPFVIAYRDAGLTRDDIKESDGVSSLETTSGAVSECLSERDVLDLVVERTNASL
ncbi:hypothetical protein F4778DRAFT_779499 [Xylariomycetidae sp. FL2044]|nr:hypothetical protein F4778DRAFT_779499 [Xylariomycetidae sp. FL2044]